MKRHLPWQSQPPVRRAACGLRDPERWSYDPRDVTCEGCKRTLKMADAEIKQTKQAHNTQFTAVNGREGA